MARPKRNLKRVNMQLPEHVLEKIDEWARVQGLSRTVAVMILCIDSLAEKGFLVEQDKE